ncbi:TonB-dependent receptor [Tenacibaculum maritimum]|uniref:TonB-dependent receptor n=1 Tax=Tenacibaculum maritimum TaxID=107401 RepID=UPI00388F6D58
MLKKQLAMIVFTMCMLSSYAQVKINGLIFDEYLEPFYGAKITNSNKRYTSSNNEGKFSIIIGKELPQTITISSFGYKTETVIINSFTQKINVVLKENILLDQVIISASRIPERIIESPVTIERFGLSDIRKNTSNSFYDGLTNLKGIQVRDGSYGYKSVNTRGFSTFNNSRFVQLVDGMDTAAPALNFSAGNIGGISELDVQSVEILPGASSALYGANAYNGILLMNTKNPFDYPGISVLLKGGATSQSVAGNDPFYDTSIRMAYNFGGYFAAKVNFSYFKAEEWHANQKDNIDLNTGNIIEGSRDTRTDYNGVNTYGDEYSYALEYTRYAHYDPNSVTRTGYEEKDLLRDYRSKNLKFSGSLHYRPFQDESLEFILTSRLSTGDNLFLGNSRYSQRNYYVTQSKLEAKGDHFYIRGYYTKNDAGDSYDIARTGILLNERASSFNSWIEDYSYALDLEKNNPNKYKEARIYADYFRLQPGTEEFRNTLKEITNTMTNEGGSRVWDKSSYIHSDGNYNFSHLMNDWADLQTGGSFRQYNPKSRGTIFNDKDEKIQINEYGIYGQIQKKLLSERLKITASLRYDKSEYFNGNFSPKFSLNYALGDEKNHILRASYQTGFRNPTIQEQYLSLDSPSGDFIVGGSIDNLNRIKQTVYIYDYQRLNRPATAILTKEDILNNSFIFDSVYGPEADGNYVKSAYENVQPENVKTFEVGYRSIIGLNKTNNLDLDINGFYSNHDNFIFFERLTVPKYGKISADGSLDADAAEAFAEGNTNSFILSTNSKSKVTSYGFGLGMHTKFFKLFDFGLNYNFIDYTLEDLDYGQFEPSFNAPKHSLKAQLGSSNLFKNLGFNLSARWNSEYQWNSSFANGIIEERTIIDAQLNYNVPVLKSIFKIGGTNLLGKEYIIVPGSGKIGSLYYISWIINN